MRGSLGYLGLVCVAIAACGGSPAGGSVARQQPLESACTKNSQPLSDFGIVTSTEVSGDAQAKVVLRNASGGIRRVSPRMVALCRGPCSGDWERCEPHRRFTPAERARYDTRLAPGESIELLVDARLDARASCEKAGLFLIAGVEGARACDDAGTWILQASAD